MEKKKVLIVGGGFAGLNAARQLAPCRRAEVTLIDRRNHHLFQPLLYQVAMAGLSPAEIASPIRSILPRRVRTLMGEVRNIDLAAHTLETEFGTLSFDYLVLACGSEQSYFGHEEWEKDAPGLKTLEQATEIRRRLLSAFELAEREPNLSRLEQFLTFVVVGGGPTGVELAGSIAEISRHTLRKDFWNIDPQATRIILVEGGARLIPAFHPRLSERARTDLEKMGVNVRCGERVTKITSNGVEVGSNFIAAKTVMWAAGVQASTLNAKLGVATAPDGRIIVGPDLSIPKHPRVFVLGDQAAFQIGGRILPGLAPVAIQQGRWVAKNIRRELKGQPRQPFRYLDKGIMATVGRSRAVVETSGMRFTGLFAWVLWLTVHIYYLIGFRNRLFVLLQWAWAYVAYRKGARLIVEKTWQSSVK